VHQHDTSKAQTHAADAKGSQVCISFSKNDSGCVNVFLSRMKTPNLNKAQVPIEQMDGFTCSIVTKKLTRIGVSG
jgi:hypothetical protein